MAVLALVGGLVWFRGGRDSATSAPAERKLGGFAQDSASSRSNPGGTSAGENSEAHVQRNDPRVMELTSQAKDALAKGATREAIGLYEQAVPLNPKDEDLHYNLGLAYARAGEAAKAEQHYRQALELLPDYPEAHNNFGNLLLHTGRMAEAEEHFQRALKLLPDYAMAHNNLGILRMRENRPGEALICFEKAVRANTNFWQACFNLGNAHLMRGNRQEAAAAYRETLRLNPACEPARKALAEATGEKTKPGP
jgi:tetratricopeptide (TPR) repeat protein